MGRLLNESQYTLGNLTASPAYAYDLAGNVAASTDGATPVQLLNQQYPCTAPTAVSAWTNLAVVNCYDPAGRAASVTSNWATYPVNMFTAGTSTSGWAPFGRLLNWNQGPSVSGSPALTIKQGYDSRLRLNSISANGQIPQ